ncbi:methionyl-tRNA formyltransferase [Microbacterium sp. NPDC076895]|uniref:methionyl-tRNA formyltransferase n=1 Tax=Microbacterium sp. NPDC076895 TaxID=3154957 RepID=UPI0034365741
MRIVFAGTPEPAVLSLRALVDAGHEVPLVITRPDAQIGRRRVVTPSPVATAADTLGLSMHRTARLDDVALEAVRAAHADLGVIVAYGGLVREPLLSTPRHGWINLHFSALPRWRGAAPVQHAIIAGDPEVGADVFQLTAGLDEGDIFGEVRFPRPIEATAGELLATLADAGADLLTTVVGQIADGTARARPQEGDPSYAPKLSIEDGRVDWQQSREQIMSRILGVTPEPGAFATAQDARLKILAAVPASFDAPRLRPGLATGHSNQVIVGTAGDPIVLVRVQPAGKPAMDAADWWRGTRLSELQFDADAQMPGDNGATA